MPARLALIFTYNVSVEIWQRQGLLDREKLLYECLLEDGVYEEVLWFTYGTDDARYGAFLKKGITIVPMPKAFGSTAGRFFYSFALPFVRAAALRRCHVIKTNQMAGSWPAVLASVLYGIPLLLRTGFTWSRNAAKKKVRKLDHVAGLVERISYRFCDAVAVTDATQAAYVERHYKVPKARMNVVPNFIDTAAFSARADSSDAEPNRCVFIGRLSEEKNLESIIEAFHGLPCGIDFYGDGPLRGDLERLARERGVDARFLGKISNGDVPGVLSRYPVFILASFFEGSPKSLLEAMAAGLACVGTAVDGIKDDVIRHEENGILVQTDAASIRAGVERLIADAALRARLGQAARRYIDEKFSLKRIKDVEAAIHRTLLTT